MGLPSTLPPAPSLKRNYKPQPLPQLSASTAQPLPIQQHTLSFLPPSAHKAYQALRTSHLYPHHQPLPPALPPLPSRARAPATTPSKPLESFDLDRLFPTADDIMLLETTTKAFGFGFHSFATAEPTAAPGPIDPTAGAAGGTASPSLAQPVYDFDRFFEEDPTPNLDYSPLTSFSASPEWCPQPLFGQEGKEAGVVDDSPLFAAEDSFDFDFSGPSLFGDAPLFPPAKPAPTATATAAAVESTMTAAASAFAALEASLAHLPVNPALTLGKPHAAAAPTTAPPSAVFSPALPSAAIHMFPPSPPHRQTSSPYPTSSSTARSALAAPAVARRATAPTGHRKGVVPEQLLDLDAPTQARSYVAPSATSRKRLPAAFEAKGGAKKRKTTTTAAADDASSSTTPAGDDGGEPPVDLADSIEAKRRQNTLAARRSRIRKLAHVQTLERSVAQLEADKAELVRFAELAMRLHPELAAVDGWGARVAAASTGPAEDGTQPMPAWGEDD